MNVLLPSPCFYLLLVAFSVPYTAARLLIYPFVQAIPKFVWHYLFRLLYIVSFFLNKYFHITCCFGETGCHLFIYAY